MGKKKFSFIDLSDDEYVEKLISTNDDSIYSEKEKIEEDSNIVVKLIEPIIENIELKEETIEPIIESNEIKEVLIEPIIENIELKEETINPIIEERKITHNFLIKEKEKLDVKTNIYLKKDNYMKIEKLYKSTGNSRSSIINTLIEIALKNIE